MMKEGKEEEKYIEMDCLPFNTFDTSDFKSENFVMHLKKLLHQLIHLCSKYLFYV